MNDARQKAEWFDSALGARVLDCERRVMEKALAQLFGFFLVQVGHWGPKDCFLGSSRVATRAIVAPEGEGVAARCDPAELPFASDSVDVIVLPHTLEFVASPHAVVREVERVLVGEGHLVVLGFSPWSMWGLRRMAGRKTHFPWNGRLLSERRLRDWLTLLDLDVVAGYRYFYRPPLSHAGTLDRLMFLERAGECSRLLPAGGYALVARKRVLTFTPLRRERRRQARIAASLAKPATRSMTWR